MFANGAFKAYVGLGELPEHVLAKYKQYGEFSSMDDLQSRSLLFLSTTDPVLDYATPSMPNLIHVGGLSVKPTQGKALPTELKHFINSSKDGIILVTFGSTISNLRSRASSSKFFGIFRVRDQLEIGQQGQAGDAGQRDAAGLGFAERPPG